MDVKQEVAVRRLARGDEASLEEACVTFGTDGRIDTEPFLRRPETVVLVAETGARIVGWVWGHELVHPHGEQTMILYSLDVAEDVRRRGVGTALVRAFVGVARGLGCTEVWVLTQDENRPAVATYTAAGGEREPVDQVMFTWPISSRSASES